MKTQVSAPKLTSAQIAEQTAAFLAKKGNKVEVVPAKKVKVLNPAR